MHTQEVTQTSMGTDRKVDQPFVTEYYDFTELITSKIKKAPKVNDRDLRDSHAHVKIGKTDKNAVYLRSPQGSATIQRYEWLKLVNGLTFTSYADLKTIRTAKKVRIYRPKSRRQQRIWQNDTLTLEVDGVRIRTRPLDAWDYEILPGSYPVALTADRLKDFLEWNYQKAIKEFSRSTVNRWIKKDFPTRITRNVVLLNKVIELRFMKGNNRKDSMIIDLHGYHFRDQLKADLSDVNTQISQLERECEDLLFDCEWDNDSLKIIVKCDKHKARFKLERSRWIYDIKHFSERRLLKRWIGDEQQLEDYLELQEKLIKLNKRKQSLQGKLSKLNEEWEWIDEACPKGIRGNIALYTENEKFGTNLITANDAINLCGMKALRRYFHEQGFDADELEGVVLTGFYEYLENDELTLKQCLWKCLQAYASETGCKPYGLDPNKENNRYDRESAFEHIDYKTVESLASNPWID